MDINVIHAETGESVPLSSIETISGIAVCPANIASLCMVIAELLEKDRLWTEPSDEMVNAGLGEVQRIAEEWDTAWDFNLSDVTDSQASDMAVFVLQAMASKRNN